MRVSAGYAALRAFLRNELTWPPAGFVYKRKQNSRGKEVVFIGVNAIDYSGYPDCRPEFIEAYQKMAALATKAGIEGRQRLRIHTPLIELAKAEVTRKGADLGIDYACTFSCYDPSADGKACGSCDACLLRKKGFMEAGIPDPTGYAAAR